jgi:hypothetical protein
MSAPRVTIVLGGSSTTVWFRGNVFHKAKLSEALELTASLIESGAASGWQVEARPW